MSHNENSQLSGPSVTCDYCGHVDAPIGYMTLVTHLDAGDWMHAAPPVRVTGMARFVACSVFCMSRMVTKLATTTAADEVQAVDWSLIDPKIAENIDGFLNDPQRGVRRKRPRRIVLPPDNIPEV